MKYRVCTTCGRATPTETGFCSYCKSPLPSFMQSPSNSNINGIFPGTTSNNDKFFLPLEFLPYHFTFYQVTGSGKTRLAMKLAIEAENRGIKAADRERGLFSKLKSMPISPWKDFIGRILGLLVFSFLAVIMVGLIGTSKMK